MAEAEDDASELSRFALHMGFVRGALSRERLVVLLLDRQVDGRLIERVKKDLMTLSEAFYRDG